jgi:hypothetical protein
MFRFCLTGNQSWLLRVVTAAVLVLTTSALVQAATFPDPRLTPGLAQSGLSLLTICNTKWGKDARHVTAAMKRQVFREYGLTGNTDPFCQPKGCEIDHLISRELGGADDVQNLWPQSYYGPWNAHMKDRVENRLHKDVCAGAITLDAAQTGIMKDWIALYRDYFGEPQP